MKKTILIFTLAFMSVIALACSSKNKTEINTEEAKEWVSNVAGKKAISGDESYTFEKNGNIIYNDGKQDRMYIFAGAKGPNQGYYYEVINLKDTFGDYSNVKDRDVYQYYGFIIDTNTITQSDFTTEAMSNALYWVGNNMDFNNADWDTYPTSTKEDIAWTNTIFPRPFVFTNN